MRGEIGAIPPAQHPHPHVIERLFNVLDQTADALEQGAIIVVEEGRFRVRRLPIR